VSRRFSAFPRSSSTEPATHSSGAGVTYEDRRELRQRQKKCPTRHFLISGYSVQGAAATASQAFVASCDSTCNFPTTSLTFSPVRRHSLTSLPLPDGRNDGRRRRAAGRQKSFIPHIHCASACKSCGCVAWFRLLVWFAVFTKFTRSRSVLPIPRCASIAPLGQTQKSCA
jgi:hypothetical protein